MVQLVLQRDGLGPEGRNQGTITDEGKMCTGQPVTVFTAGREQ